MLVPPTPATEAEVRNRARLEVIVRNRETGDELRNDLYTVSMFENTAEQFVRTASTERYRIYLGPRIIVAKDATLENIVDDFALLNLHANIQKVPPGEKMFTALIQLIRDLCKDQAQLRAELHHVSGPASYSAKGPDVAMNNGDLEDGAKATEVIYENQRSLVVGDYSPRFLLPIADKCGPWSDSHGIPKTKDEYNLPNDNWKWVDDWHIDTQRPGVDSEGWEYAFNWNMTWSAVRGATSYVRRRAHVRERVYADPAKSGKSQDSASANESSNGKSNPASAEGSRQLVPNFRTIVSVARQLVQTPGAVSATEPVPVSTASPATLAAPDTAAVPADQPKRPGNGLPLSTTTLVIEIVVLALVGMVIVLTFVMMFQLSALEHQVSKLLLS